MSLVVANKASSREHSSELAEYTYRMWELDLFLRSMLNKFAVKLTNQSHYQISRLSDEQILKLIEEKYSQLSDDEKQGIIDSVIGPLIYSIFPRTISIPKDEGMSRYMTLLEQEDHVYQPSSSTNLHNMLYLNIIVHAILFVIITIIDYVRKYIDPPPPKLEKLKLSKRPGSPKGLKGVVAEPYNRETHIVFRQDLATEGNRAGFCSKQ